MGDVFYIDAPTIPPGMTVAEYRRLRQVPQGNRLGALLPFRSSGRTLPPRVAGTPASDAPLPAGGHIFDPKEAA